MEIAVNFKKVLLKVELVGEEVVVTLVDVMFHSQGVLLLSHFHFYQFSKKK